MISMYKVIVSYREEKPDTGPWIPSQEKVNMHCKGLLPTKVSTVLF
jgi:hypothetical protein